VVPVFTAINRRTRKVATDDIPSAPAISNGRRFHHLLCGLHYPFLIPRPVRRDRMGALPMYESARYPYFSISPGNLAPDLRRRFPKPHRRNLPPTSSIASNPRLEPEAATKSCSSRSLFPCGAGILRAVRAPMVFAGPALLN
jgi:hypothetical protein